MERLVVLSTGPYLEPADLAFAGTVLSPAPNRGRASLKDLERDHIIQPCSAATATSAKPPGPWASTARPSGKS